MISFCHTIGKNYNLLFVPAFSWMGWGEGSECLQVNDVHLAHQINQTFDGWHKLKEGKKQQNFPAKLLHLK